MDGMVQWMAKKRKRETAPLKVYSNKSNGSIYKLEVKPGV